MASAPPLAHRSLGVVGELLGGVGTLARGFGFWGRRPGLMLLGLVPAIIVAVVLVGGLLLAAPHLEGVVGWLTPFADGWNETWRELFRLTLTLALFVGAILLSAFAFTALTLAVGDPFYERIWKAVEADLGAFERGPEPGFWRSVGDSLRLVARAIGTSIVLALIGLVPAVGAPIAAVLGVVLSGRLLALELTARPLEARGLRRDDRRRLLRSRNPRVIGFGVAVHLCFLIPGGAIIVMPAAVVGATLLARTALAPAAPAARVE
jgi:CysZ protein